MFEVFNNREKFYISQTAPIKAGDGLRLSVLLHDDANCYEAFLVIHRDGGEHKWLKMQWAEKVEEHFNRYDVEFVPETAGLYFYRFEFEGNWKRNYITRFEHGIGDVNPNGREWQLTVYEPDFVTPVNFGGGLIYQIFPDRFCASGAAKENVPDDRYICEDWYAQPAYTQTNEKRSLCNDYYGGDLKGIESKLGYLEQLGVTVIYLNPIFEAHSNHRYNTADYMKIDASLGTERDFVDLCRAAKQRGISIILDGVFSHTGADSKYYDLYGRYGANGAYNSQQSPYYPWFKFTDWPYGCHCWWGIPSLPEVNEEEPSFVEYICGENGVLRHWLRLGASGWRLDVADELPDGFLDKVREAIKAEKPDALLIGEVWEDASNKISHGARRRFLLGKQLDSVMNYPFREAIIRFVTGGDARNLEDTVMELMCNYPRCTLDLLMNHIGTHDTERILSVLSGAPLDRDRNAQARIVLTDAQKKTGKQLLRLAAVLQYTLPGIPSLYYGDEAGAEGLRDPFNRGGYPWGREDAELIEFYKKLGEVRKNPAFNCGDYLPLYTGENHIAYIRRNGEDEVLIAVNRGSESEWVYLPDGWEKAEIIHGCAHIAQNLLNVSGKDFVILKK